MISEGIENSEVDGDIKVYNNIEASEDTRGITITEATKDIQGF